MTLQNVENPRIGEKYHVSWANKDCVWTLTVINGNVATLRAKSGGTIVCKISDLRQTRKNETA